MNSIDWYLAKGKNDAQIALAELAHHLMCTSLPHIKVERKWNVPYYTYIKDFCYLNYFKDHLYISFYHGKLLDHPLIDMSNTKHYGKFYIKSEEDLTSDTFIQIILSAAALQDELYKK